MTNKEFENLNIGDIVTCNKPGIYTITIPGVHCSVLNKVSILQCDLLVEVLEGDRQGRSYYVESRFFDVVQSSKPDINVKLIDSEEILSLLW